MTEHASDRVAAAVRERIRSGALPPGARVPSTRALVRDHGVALATAARALGILRDEGLVVARSRVGTVVVDPLPPAAPYAAPSAAPSAAPPAAPPATTPSRAVAGAARPGRGDAPAGPDRGTAVDGASVVEAALRIADAEGLPAVSMRRIAAALGVPTMSLYGPLRGKDDLVLAMIETAFTEHPFPAVAPVGWRARLELSARRQWAIYRRRPWLARVVNLTRPQGLTGLLALADWDLAALEELDLDGRARMDWHILLCTFVRGVAVSLEVETAAAADTGVDADTWVDRDPRLQAALAARGAGPLGRVGDYALDLDHVVELGVTGILDAVAAAAPCR